MQEGVKLEVLVFDDASDDETEELINNRFPGIRYFRQNSMSGYIVLRNQGFREAQGEFVFSIDDDAYFTDPTTVAQVFSRFAEYPQTAAFAMTYAEPGRNERLIGKIDNCQRVRSFVGCAHAIRKEIALDMSGYREYLIHQGEERDLCLRMIEKGFEIRYANTPPILHCPSQVRDHTKLKYLGLRNSFLFSVVNLPFPECLGRLFIDVIQLLRYKVTLAEFPVRLLNTIRALGSCFVHATKRNPISRKAYREYRSLPSHGPIAYEVAIQLIGK